WPLSVLVVCGRTPELLSVARAESAEASGLVDFTVVGFSTEVPLLMAAADLLVGKPGGLTTSEALAAGLPFAVVDPYPLQEEANANFLLEHGAGMRIEPLTTFGHKLKNYFANDARRAAMRANARAHARPHAADAIAAELL